MSDTLGSLIDKLCTVDLKMFNAQEGLYRIRNMTLGEFQIHLQNNDNVERIFDTLKKACDLNYQRSQLIDEIDKLVVSMIEHGANGLDLSKFIQLKHKTY